MQPIQEQPAQHPYFFRKDYLEGSAYEGTLKTQTGDRVIALPEELIVGLHKAIEFETGAALPIIAYTCGRRWGARVVKRWDEAWRHFYQERMETAPFTIFSTWLKFAFRYHGWGDVEVDFSRESDGVVEFYMENSVLSRLLKDIESPFVNDIFAGLFAALMTHFADRELECAQIACEKSGAPRSHFVVATPERIERVRDVRLDDGTTEQMLEALAQ